MTVIDYGPTPGEKTVTRVDQLFPYRDTRRSPGSTSTPAQVAALGARKHFGFHPLALEDVLTAGSAQVGTMASTIHDHEVAAHTEPSRPSDQLLPGGNTSSAPEIRRPFEAVRERIRRGKGWSASRPDYLSYALIDALWTSSSR